MAIFEVPNLGMFILWHDGFLPDTDRLKTNLSKSNLEKLNQRPQSVNAIYLNELIDRSRFELSLATQKNILMPDTYFLSHRTNPSLLSDYSPVFIEYNQLNEDQKDKYRLLCVAAIDDNNAELIKNAFIESQERLGFKTRDYYSDIDRYKLFLTELSYDIAEKYISPNTSVDNLLSGLGLDSTI